MAPHKPYIAIINGPNLNLIGKRNTAVYGKKSLSDYLKNFQAKSDIALHLFQSNIEGELVDEVQKHGYQPNCIGIVLNAAAYSHYSIAIADAVEAIKFPVVEVHISNIFAREPFRHHSCISAFASAVIAGCGLVGYELAVKYLLNLTKEEG